MPRTYFPTTSSSVSYVQVEFLLDIVVDEGVRRGGELELQTTSGERNGIPRDRVEEMERILWRTGRIDDKTYVPR
jgi:hypothetical protein